MTDALSFSSCSLTFAPLDAVSRQQSIWNDTNSAQRFRQRTLSPESRQHSYRLSITTTTQFLRNITLSLLCCVLLLSRGINATHVLGASEVLPRELLFDRSVPPTVPRMHLEARNEASDQASTTIRPSGSATATGGVAIATDTSTVIPRPFDSNIGNNFTTSTCPKFFDRFLNNQTFADCLPLSLLLQVCNLISRHFHLRLTTDGRRPMASSQPRVRACDSRPLSTLPAMSTFLDALH